MILTKKLFDEDESKYISKIVEELAELQAAILHHVDDKVDRVTVLDEVADVLFQIEKIVDALSDFNPSEKRLLENYLEMRLSLVKKRLE